MAQPHTYENHLDETEAKWFAIYTHYKREKMVAEALEHKGIEHYLPIQRLLRQWGRKKRWVELPLIPCYLFVKITQPKYIAVLETAYVVKFVRFSRNLISIPEAEIDVLRRILQEGQQIEATPISYTKGDLVEITAGNLLGLQGRLIEQNSNHRFVIELENIGYAFRLEVSPLILRKVHALQAEV